MAHRLQHARRWALSWVGMALIAAVVTTGIAAYETSPRREVRGPALVDDWSLLHWSPKAFGQVKRLSYDPAAYDASRYRPSLYGIWAYLQWHTLGAPKLMRGPNVWNAVRIGGFLLALALMSVAALSPDRRRELSPATIFGLAVLPGLVVLAPASFGVDLARLGPQEPLLLAGMGLGALALLLAAWLVHARRVHPLVVTLIAVVGWLLWTFGIYMKEPAVCFFVLAPFLALELRRRWSGERLRRGTIVAISAMALAASIPLIHLTIKVAGLTGGPYGAEKPHGVGGWVTRFADAAQQQWSNIPAALGSPAWQGLVLALPALLLVTWVRARRPQWLALGFLLTGFSILVFQGVPGEIATRYYIPVYGCFAIALVIMLADLPSVIRWGAVVAAILVVTSGAPKSHDAVAAWAGMQVKDEQLVNDVAQFDPRRCPVYLTNFDLEHTHSLPTVLALHGDSGRPCFHAAGLMVLSSGPPLPESGPMIRICSGPGWRGLVHAAPGGVYACDRFKRGLIAMPDGGRQTAAQVLSTRRLVVPPTVSAP